ncbi:MAG: replication-associated recombination protein A [Candidatus Saganbacteria bacterium]|nr:replication-associated recombination protein A [Candidatus Saganbacteria bacterium]
MRPVSLDEFVGQQHLTGKDSLLTRAIKADKIFSLILFGPPGCGKTALAHIVACQTNSHFEKMNAVTAGVPEIRKLIAEAKERWDLSGKRTIAFIDEIHRFNKIQQDALLSDVEDGTIILIGATTHNPFFSVIPALVSRSQIFELKDLSEKDLKTLLDRALKDKVKGLGRFKVRIDKDAEDYLLKISNGDARRLLNALEVGALTTDPDKTGNIAFTLDTAKESIQKRTLVYDKDEDGHYDTISAFIKSMRGSNPDAALFWLAKMIYSGEDPRFIARRIVICASEDVGNADPLALVIANSAMQAVELIGMPEGRIILSQAAVYVASAPKSNASYMGIESALSDIKSGKSTEVPLHLRNAVYEGEKKMGKGKGYKYAHSYDGAVVEQEYMPHRGKYYTPTDRGFEKKIKQRLDENESKTKE